MLDCVESELEEKAGDEGPSRQLWKESGSVKMRAGTKAEAAGMERHIRERCCTEVRRTQKDPSFPAWVTDE